MKRSTVIRLVVLAGLALLIGWIASRTYWKEISVPTALRGEAATNPFYSAQHLAELLGAHAERRPTLANLPAAHSIIVLSNWNWSLIASRRERLEQWVNAGGRLVVDDSLIGGQDDIERWLGVTLKEVPRKKKSTATDDDADESEDEVDDVEDDDDQCVDLQVVADTATRDSYEVCNFYSKYSKYRLASDKPVSWGLRDEYGLQALRVKVGRGSVSFIQALPFGNRALLQADHGLVFAAMTQLQRGDAIYFIEEAEQASLLRLIWNYGAPVVVLLLAMMALILWRDGVRFGPLQAGANTARRSLAEQIRGTGQFVLQVGGGRALHAASVRALHEAATRRIAHYQRLPVNERIAAIAQLTQIDIDELSQALNYAGPRRAVELRQAIALLETARRQIEQPITDRPTDRTRGRHAD